MRHARTSRQGPPVNGGLLRVYRLAESLLRPLFAGAVLLPLLALVGLQMTTPAFLMGAVPSAEPTSPLDFTARAPADHLKDAGTAFEEAASGLGVTFQVVSRSMLYSKPDGPLIEIPDPFDRYKTLGYDTEYYLGGTIAEGIASAEGFWLQMRQGPLERDGDPDFVASPINMAALTRNGWTWRNDGEGWYETDAPPGIGLDLATVALLPKLLAEASDAAVAGSGVVDGRAAALIEAVGRIENAPGLMAIDAARFTVLAEPISFALDEEGRLVQLTAVMRNTNIDVFDLLVETVITFRYGTAAALPEPVPTWNPDAPAEPEGEGER